jgi:hypothetical protein
MDSNDGKLLSDMGCIIARVACKGCGGCLQDRDTNGNSVLMV